jgi:hypothetical protein
MERRPDMAMWVLCGALVGLSLSSAAYESFNGAEQVEGIEVALETLRTEWLEGDGLLVVPGWDDGLYAALCRTGRTPEPCVSGLIRGERFDPVRLFTHDRVWVLGRFGASSQLPGILTSDILRTTTREFSSSLSLSQFDLMDARHLKRMTDDVSALKVERRLAAGPTRPCRWRDGQHRCGVQAWLDVRVQSRNVFHRDVKWLFAHAGPDDATLAITWQDIPRARGLVVRAGYTQASVRNEGGSPTLVRTFVDDALVGEVELAPHRYSQSTQVLTPAPGPSTMTVRIEISASDASWRQVMLQANLFDALPATLEAAVDPHGDRP